MAVTMDVCMPSEAAAAIEALNLDLGVQKDRLPDGLNHHFATRTTDGFNIFEVWESQEAFDRFADNRLLLALKKLVGAKLRISGRRSVGSTMSCTVDLRSMEAWVTNRGVRSCPCSVPGAPERPILFTAGCAFYVEKAT